MNNLQQLLDTAYDEYIVSLNKKQYLDRIKQIEKDFTSLVKEEFSQRQDSRTFHDFAENMIFHMEKEREIADYWMGNFGQSWFGTDKYTYTGIEAAGRLICRSSKLRREFKQPDLFLPDNNEHIELKSCRVLTKAIYKEADIRHYHRLGNVNIVTLHSEGKFSLEKVKFYTLLTPTGLSLLIAKIDSGKIQVESRSEFGGKKCVHFTREQLSDTFYVQQI